MPELPPPVLAVIADDHPIVSEGLRRFLRSIDDIEVVGTASSVDALFLELDRLEGAQVVVLDVDFPGMAGADTVRALRARGLGIVLFTHHDPSELVATMILAGAKGFVSKSDPVDDLVEAIVRVRAGGEWLSSAVRELVARSSSVPPHTRLTDRELAVFSLLVRGRTPKEIGFELDLASSTVYAHVEKVRAKLGVTSVADVARYAATWGLASR